MSNALAVLNPYDFFVGLDGKALNGGYIYVGVAGQDPEIAPVQLYWDTAGTQPAAQPLRTLQGYVVNGSAPARVVVNGTYSLRVRDKQGRQVYFTSDVLLAVPPFQLAGGSAASPPYGFNTGAGTGMYSPAANQIGFAYGGVLGMLFANGGLAISEPGSGPALQAQGTVLTPAIYGIGSAASGQSFGLQIDAGTTSADSAVLVRNQAGTQTLFRVKGDGSFQLGNNGGNTLLSSSGNDLVGKGIPLARYKAITTAITGSSTLTDDPELGAALGAGTYAFQLWLPVYASAANSLKWSMAFSGTQTNFFYSAQYTAGGVAGQTSIVAPGALTFALATTGLAGADVLRVDGTITVTVTGSLTFQEAQNTANANTVNIGKGAWMKVTKVS